MHLNQVGQLVGAARLPPIHLAQPSRSVAQSLASSRAGNHPLSHSFASGEKLVGRIAHGAGQ